MLFLSQYGTAFSACRVFMRSLKKMKCNFQQTRQETVSQRFRTLIDKAVIVKYCPEFTDNIAYEWLGYGKKICKI